MFKNILGFKIVLFLFIAFLASFLIFRKFIIGNEREPRQYKLTNSWVLPSILEEISGMEYLQNNKVLCIQDEDGYLFIYSLETSKIDKKIKFGGGGDYESIAVVKDTVYVLRSDGKLFEIKDFLNKVDVKTYDFNSNIRYNFEGLYYDYSENRLLLATKYKAKKDKDTKPIFSFDLTTKQYVKEPVFSIPLNHEVLKNTMEFMPSSIDKDHAKNEFYLLDGRHQKLLILDSLFTPIKLYHLDDLELPQPESTTFSKNKTFISTEADRGVLQQIYEIELD